jgi:hypothetical protein
MREREASGQEVRKTRAKSRTALVANRIQFLLDPIDDINGSSQT